MVNVERSNKTIVSNQGQEYLVTEIKLVSLVTSDDDLIKSRAEQNNILNSLEVIVGQMIAAEQQKQEDELKENIPQEFQTDLEEMISKECD